MGNNMPADPNALPQLVPNTAEVLLDTNALRHISWPNLNAAGSRLLELLRELRIEIGIPDVVVAEARGLFEREVEAEIRKLSAADQKLDQLLDGLVEIPKPTVQQYLTAYDERSHHLMALHKVSVHQVGDIPGAPLLNKWARKLPPFRDNAKGTGWRDAIILEVLKRIGADGRPRAYVSYDGDFGGTLGELHGSGITLLSTVDVAIQALQALLTDDARGAIVKRQKALFRLLRERADWIRDYLRQELRLSPSLLTSEVAQIDAASIDSVEPARPLVYEDRDGNVRFAFTCRVHVTFAGRTASEFLDAKVAIVDDHKDVFERAALIDAIKPEGMVRLTTVPIASATDVLVRVDARATRTGDDNFDALEFLSADALIAMDPRVIYELAQQGEAPVSGTGSVKE